MRIIFNPEFKRFEVYRENPIIRNGQAQPVFVSAKQLDCIKYCNKVEQS